MTSSNQRERADELVTSHLAVVYSVLRSVARTLPSHVDRDDLRSAGYMGLICAARTFDPSRGIPFAAFASRRVRGAMLDELRAQDWSTRAVRAADRRRAQAADTLSGRLGRNPSTAEVAEELGLSAAEIHRGESRSYQADTVSLQELQDRAGEEPHDETPGPLDLLSRSEEHAGLRTAIEALPGRLSEVVLALYFQDRSTADVAADLKLSCARVSQMRREAIALLGVGLGAHVIAFTGPGGRSPERGITRRGVEYRAALAGSAPRDRRLQLVPA